MPASFQVHISSRPADHRTNTITVEDDVFISFESDGLANAPRNGGPAGFELHWSIEGSGALCPEASCGHGKGQRVAIGAVHGELGAGGRAHMKLRHASAFLGQRRPVCLPNSDPGSTYPRRPKTAHVGFYD